MEYCPIWAQYEYDHLSQALKPYIDMGIKVLSEKEISSVKADIVIREFRKEQPSIGKAISKGYWLARNYILSRINT